MISTQKPEGFTKNPIKSSPCLELDLHTNCYVSVEHPCDSGALGAREFFHKYGYMVIRGLYDPEELKEEPPKERGQINYYGSIDKFSHELLEQQVNGSLARYSHPKFKYIHFTLSIFKKSCNLTFYIFIVKVFFLLKCAEN